MTLFTISVFRKISTWNMFNFVCDYKVTLIFQMMAWDKFLILYMGKYCSWCRIRLPN
jgi:hypothetical protein